MYHLVKSYQHFSQGCIILCVLGIISVDSDATGQLLIIYSAFGKYLRKNGNTMKQCISSL